MTIEEQYKHYGVIHTGDCGVCEGLPKSTVRHFKARRDDYGRKLVFLALGLLGGLAGAYIGFYVAMAMWLH